ncbi:MAG TPA: hypothetical protein VG714_05900 [Acidobacteriaceae bacterium]|nr:hypothetical protein [Acidobacteriaceae bacterium]
MQTLSATMRYSPPSRIGLATRIIETAVSPLRLLVDAFVNTFGITRPAPEAEARAGRAIALMLLAVLSLLIVAVWVLRSALFH